MLILCTDAVLNGRFIKHESAGLNLVCASEAPRRALITTNKFSPYACAWALNLLVLVIMKFPRFPDTEQTSLTLYILNYM